MRKAIIFWFLIGLTVILSSQITEFEHRNIPTAPEAMEIVDSFLICAEGQFIEVFNANSDSLISENIHDFGNYIYDIKSDENFVFVSPWFWGDSIGIYYRDSLPSLTEYQKIQGFYGFDMNDSLFITSVRESLLIYKYLPDSFNVISRTFISSYSLYRSVNPVMIYDTFFLPEIGIADLNNPYELADDLPHAYIIEDTIMYGMYRYEDYMATYNISDINNVVLLDTIHVIQQDEPYNFPTEKQNMEKLGNYLFVNFTGEQDDNNKFMIFDVSDPSDIKTVNTISENMDSDGRHVCNDLAVYNDKLYFGRSEMGLQVYNINDTVSPIFDYTLGSRPLGIFRDYSGTIMKTYLTEEKYVMADKQGIYTCNKNSLNYNDNRINIDSITAYCAGDSVISIVKNNGNGTETFMIIDMNGNIYDSINFTITSTMTDYLIMIDDYIYLKHNDNEFQTKCAIYKRDSLNRLSLINSFDMNLTGILDYEFINNRLVILDYAEKLTLFDIDNPSVPYCLDSINLSETHNYPFQFLTHYKDMLFVMHDEGGIDCYTVKQDYFDLLWEKPQYFYEDHLGIKYCNGYIVQFYNIDFAVEQAKLFTFDETGILDSLLSYDFNLVFGEAVVESNYIYFPEIGAGYNRVRVGPKKQECIVPDSMHIGSITMGDSLIYTVPVFNNGDSTLVIDSVVSSTHTAINTSLPVSVSPRDTLDMEFITYEYASQMDEYIQFYTNDMYDIYNEAIITAEQLAGIDSKPERIKEAENYISISNSTIKLSISEKTIVEYRMFDVTGRVVDYNNTTKQAGVHRIDLGRVLKPGVYFVDVKAGEMKLNKKIVIID